MRMCENSIFKFNPRVEFETKQQRTSTHRSLALSAWLEITQAWPNFLPISGPAKEGGSFNLRRQKNLES